jgi:hypothetical protein
MAIRGHATVVVDLTLARFCDSSGKYVQAGARPAAMADVRMAGVCGDGAASSRAALSLRRRRTVPRHDGCLTSAETGP